MQANILIAFLALLTVPLSITIIEGVRKLSRYHTSRRSARSHGCKDPPFENPYDLFGLLKTISSTRHLLKKTALASATESFGKYGETYTSRIIGEKSVFTCDPRNIKQVLVARFVDYDSSVTRAHILRPITEHGIFAVDGAEWKVARDMYRNQFSNTRRIIDLEVQERHFQAFLSRLSSLRPPYDLQPLFLNLTLDLTTAFAMGESVDSLSFAQPDDKKHFVESLIYLKKRMARDGFIGPLHVLLSKKDFYRACADVKRYVERYIAEALDRRQQRKGDSLLQGKGSEGYNLLDGLTENSDDMVSLRDAVITILIAGIDSVAGLLSTTFWLLARDERVFQKLRANTLEYIGQEAPTYEQLRNFSYLRQVLNEGKKLLVLRYRPSKLTLRALISHASLSTCAIQREDSKQGHNPATRWRRRRRIERPRTEGAKSGVLNMGHPSEHPIVW